MRPQEELVGGTGRASIRTPPNFRELRRCPERIRLFGWLGGHLACWGGRCWWLSTNRHGGEGRTPASSRRRDLGADERASVSRLAIHRFSWPARPPRGRLPIMAKSMSLLLACLFATTVHGYTLTVPTRPRIAHSVSRHATCIVMSEESTPEEPAAADAAPAPPPAPPTMDPSVATAPSGSFLDKIPGPVLLLLGPAILGLQPFLKEGIVSPPPDVGL